MRTIGIFVVCALPVFIMFYKLPDVQLSAYYTFKSTFAIVGKLLHIKYNVYRTK